MKKNGNEEYIEKNEEKKNIDVLKENEFEILKEDADYDIIFKIMLIGDASVGKSTLINKLLKQESSEKSTIGFDLRNVNIKVKDKICKLEIWDTCGQENYRSLMTKFYKNSSLMILVYAINNRKSYDGLDYWFEQIKKHCKEGIKIILVGNKSDLNDERIVSEEEGKKYCQENNFDSFFESNFHEDKSIEKIFFKCVDLLYKEFINMDIDDIRLTIGSIDKYGLGDKNNIPNNSNTNKTNDDNKNKDINNSKGKCCQ